MTSRIDDGVSSVAVEFILRVVTQCVVSTITRIDASADSSTLTMKDLPFLRKLLKDNSGRTIVNQKGQRIIYGASEHAASAPDDSMSSAELEKLTMLDSHMRKLGLSDSDNADPELGPVITEDD